VDAVRAGASGRATPRPSDSCPWCAEADDLRGVVVGLQTRLAELEAQIAKVEKERDDLKRRFLGRKSEKMPPVKDELKAGKEPTPDGNPEADPKAKPPRRRKKKWERQLQKLEQREVPHRVPPELRVCPNCGCDHLKPVGGGHRTSVLEVIPARILEVVHVQETLACPRPECDYIVRADGAQKVVEKGRYGASILAYVVLAKCSDSMPVYRLAKWFRRHGLDIPRSTLNDLLHYAAELLKPLAVRLLKIIAAHDVVQADETSMRVVKKGQCKNGFLWTFRADKLIGYVFSRDRSGETPRQILGGTQGTLVVDAHTGYNSVVDVDGRERAGCHAHLRRKVFEGREEASEAKELLGLILDLYRVEHEALERRIVGTKKHLKLRRKKSAPIRARMHAWLLAHKDSYPPKSRMAAAVRYGLNQWKALGQFLQNPRVPLDNNASERALRVAAIGRKNFLFVGNLSAGRNLAVLYSLIATCEANGVNPFEYLTDVLGRLGTHLNSRIDELLPQNWRPATRSNPNEQRSASTPEATADAVLAADEQASADAAATAPEAIGPHVNEPTSASAPEPTAPVADEPTSADARAATALEAITPQPARQNSPSPPETNPTGPDEMDCNASDSTPVVSAADRAAPDRNFNDAKKSLPPRSQDHASPAQRRSRSQSSAKPKPTRGREPRPAVGTSTSRATRVTRRHPSRAPPEVTSAGADTPG
jgi:transposase